MSNTIDYGIDLGTTNSAIAKYENGEVRVFKNRDQMDVTPSVVRIEKTGRIIVGKRAYQLLYEDFENVDSGFKRWMGQSDPRYFKAANKSLTAEELSAEVLKSVLEDARQVTGETFSSAVITVPAAFGQLQCEATARAASLAGLIEFPLLQEPLAAAIAYGMKSDAINSRWLVYDLGGGTFDIAVVSTKDGQLRVLEHRGNNMLGGLDFDRLVVRKLLWPKLQESFNLPEAGKAVSSYRRLIQILHREAEQAKIDLSFSEKVTISLFNVGDDDDQKPIEIEMEISRSELNILVEGLINKTILLCKQAINDAHISREDIAKVVLVGGPTHMPIIRDMLSTELNLPLDFSIDPMTVVARGAAIYASTIGKQRSKVNLNKATDTLNITLAHESVWSDTSCLVAGRIEGENDTALEILIESDSKHWTSGWMPITDNYFEVYVQLLEGKTTNFNIFIRDRIGNNLVTNIESFSIRHGLALSEPPLPHSIGAEFVRPDGTTTIEIIFPRSTPLPAQTIVHCKADKTLRPSKPDDYIAIKIWEGEFPDPEANIWVGALKINAAHIQRPLPEGADIELSIAISASRLMEVEAFVPILNQHFREGVYIPDESKEQIIEKVKKIQFELDRYFYRIRNLESMADEIDIPSLKREIQELSARLEEIYLEGHRHLANPETRDPGDAKRVFEEFREVRGNIGQIEKKLKSEGKMLFALRKFEWEKEEARKIVDKWGDKFEKKEFELLCREAERHISREDETALEKTRSEVEALNWHIRFKQNGFWQDTFELLQQPHFVFTNRELAEKYLSQGHKALEKEQWDKLKENVIELCKLLPQDPGEIDKQKILRAGIRRG
ncbi:MAG: Hsp70 family protein [Acidobacteria bacterium]|nr:Hsp70 family protein [Acidobacteriota bacterium]